MAAPIGGRMGVRRIRPDGHVHGHGRGRAGRPEAAGWARRVSGAASGSEPAAQRFAHAQAVARRPPTMARFISRPVSSAAPKRPSGSTASTSSLVWPARAISKSWMAAAPFMRKGGGVAAAHQVDQHRRQAALDHVAAQPPDDGAPLGRAPRHRRPPRRETHRPPECAAANRASPAMPAPGR